MKKITFLSLLFLAIPAAFGAQVGPADSVQRMPHTGSIGGFGSIDLSKSNAVGSSILGTANGGTGVNTPGAAGNYLVSNGTNWTQFGFIAAHGLQNVGIKSSVSSHQLTINLTSFDGSSDCSSSAPCIFTFRSSTGSNGSYTTSQVTSALSINIGSGATIGHVSGMDQYVWVYALNDGGVIDLCVSGVNYFNQGTNQASTLTPASSGTVLYCGSSHSGSKPIRFIGRGVSNQSVAGTWDANITDWQIDPAVFPTITEQVAYTPSNTQGFGSPATNLHFVSWREGAMLRIQGSLESNTATGAEARLSIGYNGSSGNVTSATQSQTVQVIGTTSNPESSATFFGVCPLIISGSTFMNFGAQTSTTPCQTIASASTFIGNSHFFSLDVSIPINGWSTYGPP